MLTKVYFEDSQYIISIKQARAIVKTLSSSDRIIKIYASNQMVSVFEMAIKIMKSSGIVKIKSLPQPTHIIPTSKKRVWPDECVNEEHEYALQRTPSPVNDMVENITAEIKRFKKKIKTASTIHSSILSTISNNTKHEIPTRSIPMQLQAITKESYKTLELNGIQTLNKPTSKEDIDMIMDYIAPKIIESVFLVNTMWYFATQFELYEREAKLIDDCAIEQNYYPTSPSPTAIIHKKTDKGRSWHELSIFWDTHELLITGGLAGTNTGVVGTTAFLGPSLPILIPSFNNNEIKILVRIHPADFIQRERRLRNYGKYAAGYK
ncbi:unnamed protein product [Cunninghamella echinulata]